MPVFSRTLGPTCDSDSTRRTFFQPPSAGVNFKFFCGFINDVQRARKRGFHPFHQIALIRLIGPDPLDGGRSFKQSLEERTRAPTVVDVGGMNGRGENTIRCIYYDMMCSALDLFAAVEPRFLGGFRRALHALAIDDAGGRFFISTVFFRNFRRISSFARSKNPDFIHLV